MFNLKKETLSDEEILFATLYGHAFTPGQLDVCAAGGGADGAGAEYKHDDFYTEQSGTKHAEQYHPSNDDHYYHHARPNDADDNS